VVIYGSVSITRLGPVLTRRGTFSIPTLTLRILSNIYLQVPVLVSDQLFGFGSAVAFLVPPFSPSVIGPYLP
jgi:hypothetical protein